MAAIPKFDEPVCEEPAFRLTSIGVEDYLAAEDGAGFRSEYIAGQVFAMTGASATHNIICVNLALALAPHARAGGCQFFLNDMKLRLSLRGIDCFYYPDAMICCDPADDHPLYRERPCLLVEVLSESTARIDRPKRERLRKRCSATAITATMRIASACSNDRRIVSNSTSGGVTPRMKT